MSKMLVRRMVEVFPVQLLLLLCAGLFQIVSAVECGGPSYFTLIDNHTQQDLSVLPDIIYLERFPKNTQFNIRADFTPPCTDGDINSYRSVLIVYNSTGEKAITFCDKEPPFTVFGDYNYASNTPPLDRVGARSAGTVRYSDHTLIKSNCTIKAIPFMERNCQGLSGRSLQQSIQIVEYTAELRRDEEQQHRVRDVIMMTGKTVQCSVGDISAIQLISGDGETVVETLKKHENDKSILSMAQNAGNYSLRAITKPCTTGSVRSVEFVLRIGNQKFVSTVSREPYILPLPHIAKSSQVLLVATPYSQTRGRGEPGPAQRFTFSMEMLSFRSQTAVSSSAVCRVGNVTSLFLVSQDLKIMDEIQDNKILCIPRKYNYSIRALATPCTTNSMRSVRLVLRIGDQQFIEKEDVDPYTLLLPKITKNTSAVILATPFSDRNAKGFEGATKRIAFTMASCRVPCTVGDITEFQITSESGDFILKIKDNAPVCIPNNSKYSIRAIAKPCSESSISSVKLVLRVDGRVVVRNEDIDPYTIDLPKVTKNTTATLTATPYSQTNARGEEGQSKTIQFPIMPCPVLNSTECRVVRFLYEGTKMKKQNTLCFAKEPVLIEAVVHCPKGHKPSKVVFEMKGQQVVSNTDYSKPYTLQGSAGVELPLGSYKLEATPYEASATGESFSIRLSVVDCTPTKAPTANPPPTTRSNYLCAESSGRTNPDGFQICLDLLNVPKTDEFLFKSVSDQWSRIISADLPDAPSKSFGASWACNQYPETIDDLYICGKYEELDGPGNVLGVGNYMYQRAGSRLPATGYMSFDIADVDALRKNKTLEPLLLHEMGHVLGLGTMWDDLHLADGCVYSGKNANRAWQDISMCSGASVPLGQNERLCRHWDEFCLKDELMTGFFRGENRPILSKITVGGLEDLGYEVDYSHAETFTSKNVDPSCLCERQLRKTNAEWKSAPQRGLSTEGLQKARDAGMQHLRKMIPPVSYAEGVEFTAHQQVSVLYMEGDEIYHVLVTNRD